MPPQQTTFTSEAERDAAVLRLDRSIALAKEAMDEVLTAAARLNASVAAPRGTLSPTEGARAAVEPAQSLRGLFKRYWRACRQWYQSPRFILQDLSDRELTDIGLTRGEVYHLAPWRAIDALRDRARYLLNHSGM
ncbi:DUF1127 domain-containing protein [uncultured Bradyrhizobium sp.]|jgi:uncharacterized protein YjiS (DUF1127 family)|uniref:DUF1127 domain-containing protein n=1 Tax=uncultured Bradyrhizobium sp. TaxID=199684 RepID=UPI00262ACC11|nr:DUF1127 domain-containing protein [uncultured Bradyrhizobium sp.]